MENNRKMVPKRRFKEFQNAGDWEQRKLGECFSERVESMPNGELISVTINNGVKKFSELGRHDNSNENKSKYKKVCVGDIAYNSMRMWQGASGYSPYEGIVSPAYTVLSPNKSVYSKCVAYQFKLPQMIHTFKINSQGITSDNWNLKYTALSRITIYISNNLKEQKQIAGLFAKIDNLITLHQRKLEKIKAIKKAYLSEMFPQNGEKQPRRRFRGFTDDWEQRKLLELAEKTYGGGTPTTSNEAYWKGNIPWIQSSDIVDGKLFDIEPRKYITQDGLNNSAAQLVPKNSIAIITRVGVGKLAFMPFSYATSQDFLSLSKLNAEPLFTVYACYKKLQSELNAIQGTSIKGITKDELLAKVIMVTQYAEQQQIGTFFSQLDNLITLHQRKLEKLKNIKKAYLNEMFV